MSDSRASVDQVLFTPSMDNKIVGQLSEKKLPKNLIVEALDAEKQLWRLVYSKGLLHAGVRQLYVKACSNYEKIILHDHELAELQDIEYSLWKLHYKHIDEYRNRLRETMSSVAPKNSGTVDQGRNDLLDGFKSFLSEASEFYQGLIIKIRRINGLPEEIRSLDEDGFVSYNDSSKLYRIQFSCHRCLVSLGDLARYRELYGNPYPQKRNWSIAATHYLNASIIWPDSGNPHNQLAVLATYVGDELLALYHCLRSLAVKEPFPDAWDNLILLFEKNGASHLHTILNEATFNFLKPSERSIVQFKAESNGSMVQMRKDSDGALSDKAGLWSLIVRMIGFFYINSSLEEFPIIFGSVIRELEAMLSTDDATLKGTLESYQQMGIARTGPFRIIQLVAILIYTIHTLGDKSKLQKRKNMRYTQQPELIKLAVASAFICMRCFVDRCLKTNPVESSPLLPSILVFMEFLVDALDRAETYTTDEKCANAISYFFSAFVDLLNHFTFAVDEAQHFIALWEDNELRGFSPIAQSHQMLSFSNCDELRNRLEDKNEQQLRISRIVAAAIKVVDRSNEFHKWISYDKVRRKFHFPESEKLTGQAETEIADCIAHQEAEEQNEVEVAKDEPNKVDKNGSSSPAEEEEVILFKPITRYNSAPIYMPATTANDEPSSSIWEFKAPQEERLNRGSSFPENQFCFDSSSFLSNATSSSSSKAFWQEPIPEDSEIDSFPDHPTDFEAEDTKTDVLPSVAGPPSLNAWVLNRENSGFRKGEVLKESNKCHAGNDVGVASLPLTDLSIGETTVGQQDVGIAPSIPAPQLPCGSSSVEDSLIHPQYSSDTMHHSVAPYTTPVPSAPLLPENASWYNGGTYSYDGGSNSEGFEGKADFSQVYLSILSRNQDSSNYDLWSPRFTDACSPIPGRTSSPQWSTQYNGNLNINRTHNGGLPFHPYTLTYLGSLHDNNVSGFAPDRLAINPSDTYPLHHVEGSSLRPGWHVTPGANEQMRDKLFHHEFQKPTAHGFGALQELMSERQGLLRYLKEKEWRAQEAQLGGP
ncbi:hypothetical protein Scep_011350 [Stephania cephalantha]|uniref:Protein SMG7L n=1 Tax=Stephania cephalantha TaxID=152367 RepID=A0AAP0JF66_9MAGN